MANNTNNGSWDTIVASCLDRLQNGGTIEDCLRQYPEHREQLEPFLQTVNVLSEPRRVVGDAADARMKAKMLAAYRENEQIEKSPVSYVDSLRYAGRNETNQQRRRHDSMNKQNKQPFFTRFAGAIAGLAILLVLGVYTFTNLTDEEELFSVEGIAKSATVESTPATVATATPTPIPTRTPEFIRTPTSVPPPTPTLTAAQFDGYESTLSPDGKWEAVAAYHDYESDIYSDGERYSVIHIIDTTNGEIIYEPFRERAEIYPEREKPIVIGWSADSRYLFYAGTVDLGECGRSYRYLRRFDVNHSMVKDIGDYGVWFADVKMSPAGTQLAIMNTQYNNVLTDDPLTVDVIDVTSAEIVAQTRLSDSDTYSWGELRNTLLWAPDGSQLLAILYTMKCPSYGENMATQSIPLDGSVESEPVLLDVMSADETTIELSDGTPHLPPISKHGSWVVTESVNEMVEEGVMGMMAITLTVTNQETDVTYTILSEAHPATRAEYTLPHQIGWSSSGRYFYFAERVNVNDCGQRSFYTDVRRVDVSNGTVEAVAPDSMQFTPEISDIAMSPDSTQFAFIPRHQPDGGGVRIHLVDAESGMVTAIAPFSEDYATPMSLNRVHWSTAGVHLVAELYNGVTPTEGCEGAVESVDFHLVPNGFTVLPEWESTLFSSNGGGIVVEQVSDTVLTLVNVEMVCQYQIALPDGERLFTDCLE